MSEDLLVPPLPPGCLLVRSGEAFGDGVFWLYSNRPLPRQVIACYMRCAWKDEAERLGRSQQPWQQNVAALAAAEAWRIWGENK